MTPPKFDELSECFTELAQKELDKFQKENQAQFSLASDWLIKLQHAYEAQTKSALKSYTKTGPSGKLDRHKVAAALLMATMYAQPFKLQPGESPLTNRCREANVFLAVEIGCLVILLFGITEANLTENSDLGSVYASSDYEALFDLQTGNGDGNYLSQLVKAINVARRGDNPVPEGYALLLSHIYFLLQRSFERIQCERLGIAPNGESMDLHQRMLRIEALIKAGRG